MAHLLVVDALVGVVDYAEAEEFLGEQVADFEQADLDVGGDRYQVRFYAG
jgi:hypothetical protein